MIKYDRRAQVAQYVNRWPADLADAESRHAQSGNFLIVIGVLLHTA